MTRTFEELAGSEMDALYQGALFLSGGDPHRAEELVVDAVVLAFQEHAAEVDSEQTRRWLEARLVRAHLRRSTAAHDAAAPGPVDRRGIDPESFDALGPDELFAAARTLPPGPRAALWLVLLRRWSHRDAARAMEIDDDVLERFLGYRDELMRELIGRGGARRRSGGAS